MLELIKAQDWDALQTHCTLFALVVFVAWIGMVAACMADLVSGVDAAKAIGEKLHSHGLRETVKKVKDYTGVMFPFMFIDIIGSVFSWYTLPYVEMAIAVGSILIEGWSVIENKRRKHSHAALLPEMVKEVIGCSREKDAVALIEAIQKVTHEGALQPAPEGGEVKSEE